MADLTVLVSPIPQYPLYPSSASSVAARRNRSPSPIMVTLEPAPARATSEPESVARTARPAMDPGLLSPPMNTWKARPRPHPRGDGDSRGLRPTGTGTHHHHRPRRSQSAPPTQTAFDHTALAPPPQPTLPVSAATAEDFDPTAVRRHAPRRTQAFGAGYSYVSGGMTLRGGELVRPPPPLRACPPPTSTSTSTLTNRLTPAVRPTTFWRRAHRSGVAAASYSPAAHLVRRSTFIAAGLALDAPLHDLSALGVESRISGAEGITTRPRNRVVEIPQAFELLNL
ncbi:hypothetical protein GGX14DRAFT_555577 [Mycena pura]|uniref:Uncharacterized protein n=1 Tax=Mycena pura TaxID=153505 RepID=A0AAD7E3P1_9AGAR|nr:hypothetical protein GGX14DRAFT_555577 [Mycena pura]